jgi:hypothetical protein
MRTWPKPLLRAMLKIVSLLLIFTVSTYAENPIMSKVGAGTLIIFNDRVVQPKGEVDIGQTIQIRYWLKISGPKPRFISLDASSMTAQGIRNFKPVLSSDGSTNKKWSGGFYIRSSRQSNLDVTINPNLWAKVQDLPTRQQLQALEKTLAHEANLNVIIGREKGGYKVLGVIVD